MKKVFVIILLCGIAIIILKTLLFPSISNFVGWYGYKVWENRSKTTSIKDSKQRKVFVKELNYKIVDSVNLKDFSFKPYLEKGYNVGRHSYNETRIIMNTNFPYNITYEKEPKQSVGIYFKSEDEKKLDSFDGVWGYMKTPYLRDTLNLEIIGENRKGTIKIW